MEEPTKTPPPSVWHQTSTYHFLHWISRPRTVRRMIIVVVWIVALVALLFGEENLRGRHAWNQYRKAAEARGNSLDFATYVPKPVLDDQNFAATPLLQSFVQQSQSSILTNDFYAQIDNHIKSPPSKSGQRQFKDLVAWQKAAKALQNGPLGKEQKFGPDDTSLAARAAAAPVILEGMKSFEPNFAELRAASTREFSRYPLKYDFQDPSGILLPHLAKIKQLCDRLNLQACAELANGQPEQTLGDVKLCQSLADSIKSEPFFISFLVREACLHDATHPVWEGLAENRWTEAQLQELETRFASYNFIVDSQQSLKAEAAMATLTIDSALRTGLGRLLPTGWSYREKLNYEMDYDEQVNGVIDLMAKTISPTAAEANARNLAGVFIGAEDFPSQSFGKLRGKPLEAFLHHHLMASMFLPALKNFFSRIAAAQVTADETSLACALQRYRLANGQYPETLEPLSPKFMARIPNDVIGGQPYKYRRTDDGKFILYSIGWNQKDDGGVSSFDPKQGDWVWSYPNK
jgi:hypothetical protein